MTERLLYAEIDALRTVLAGYVHDIERANARVEAYEMQIAHDAREREGLMDQVQEFRNIWSASRHYKRLRNYRRRTQVAEYEALVAKDRLIEAVAYLGRTPAAAITNRDIIERLS